MQHLILCLRTTRKPNLVENFDQNHYRLTMLLLPLLIKLEDRSSYDSDVFAQYKIFSLWVITIFHRKFPEKDAIVNFPLSFCDWHKTSTYVSQYIREAYEHKERKGHPQIAWKLKETVSKLWTFPFPFIK